MIETTNEMAKAIEAIREDVLYGLKGDANRVVREAKSLIGYLQELIARLPGDMREFDINDAAQYNAIIRIVEAVEGSDRDMTRTWKEAHMPRPGAASNGGSNRGSLAEGGSNEGGAMITKMQFDRYEMVRLIGIVNMFDVEAVMKLAKLSRVDVLTIMKRYEAIRGEFYPPAPAEPEPEPEVETAICLLCNREFPASEAPLPFDRLTGDVACPQCMERRRIVSRIPKRYAWRIHGRGEL